MYEVLAPSPLEGVSEKYSRLHRIRPNACREKVMPDTPPNGGSLTRAPIRERGKERKEKIIHEKLEKT